MRDYLIAAGLAVVAAGILATFVAAIRREPDDPADAPTAPLPPAATDDELLPGVARRRRLADDWREQIAPDDDQLTYRPYVLGRHSEDTIDLHRVPAGWRPAIGRARIAAVMRDTGVMDLGEVNR